MDPEYRRDACEDINVEETKRQLADAADGECPQCAHLRDWPRGPKGEN
jgi:hypothetical protein